MVTVGRGPSEVDVAVVEEVLEEVLEEVAVRLVVSEAVIAMLAEEVDDIEDISIVVAVELMVETSLANDISGALAPKTMTAASDISSPPLIIIPTSVLSMH